MADWFGSGTTDYGFGGNVGLGLNSLKSGNMSESGFGNYLDSFDFTKASGKDMTKLGNDINSSLLKKDGITGSSDWGMGDLFNSSQENAFGLSDMSMNSLGLGTDMFMKYTDYMNNKANMDMKKEQFGIQKDQIEKDNARKEEIMLANKTHARAAGAGMMG